MKKDMSVSRRDFVTAGAGVAAAMLTTSQAFAAQPGAATSRIGGALCVDAKTFAWDREADVIVVGCGGAGACAAIAAREAGCDVIVLEKGAITGGSTALSGQAIALAGTEQQKELGIEDDADAFAEFLHAACDADNDLLDVVAYGSLDTFEWIHEMGVNVPAQEGVPGITFGGTHDVQPEVPRTHWTEGLWVPIEQHMTELGVETLTETPAVALVVDDATGEACGVQTQDGTVYGARRGVVLAAGGFAHNPELMKENMLKNSYVSFSGPNDDGGGIKLGQSVGAGTAFLASGNDCPAYPEPEAACRYFVESSPIDGDPAYIAVNKSGKRFTNEYDFQIPINRDIMNQTDGICYVIACGEEGAAGFNVSSGANAGEPPAGLVQADTIEELAGQLGLDAETLTATVEDWNASCEAGKDAAFGRTQILKPLDTAPYTACEVWPGFASTLSGLRVDTSMQVLSALDGEPIKRLYAAGANSCVAGRIYPECGFGVISALVTGRVAGESVAALDARA